MFGLKSEITQHLQQLEGHLSSENPVLLDVIQQYRQLDRVARKTGLLDQQQSFAARIPWWPLISVLGTFSAGKSTFINQFLDDNLQNTGNQAVDDKFTVICYSKDEAHRVLPGVALNSDSRFPFYQISDALEHVTEGEGNRVDAYLQLKTTRSDKLRGMIFIDSPGFDADSQRTETLKLTDHIIELSDLVLVFFDARHPEPGAMKDTLEHLVSETIRRHDSNKFLYILNQIDTTAKEDNPEDIIASWQRALAQNGLTAGKFYTIYNKSVANPIDDTLIERFERKCDEDIEAINTRIAEIKTERTYRVIDGLIKNIRILEEKQIPTLRSLISRWRTGVYWRNILFWILITIILLGSSIALGHWQGIHYRGPWLNWLTEAPYRIGLLVIVFFAVMLIVHSFARRSALVSVLRYIDRTFSDQHERDNYRRAIEKNTRWWRSIFRPEPVGWSKTSKRKLDKIISSANTFIKSLNDQFTFPSGSQKETEVVEEYSADDVKAEQTATAI